jgi:hypothetical protein
MLKTLTKASHWLTLVLSFVVEILLCNFFYKYTVVFLVYGFPFTNKFNNMPINEPVTLDHGLYFFMIYLAFYLAIIFVYELCLQETRIIFKKVKA